MVRFAEGKQTRDLSPFSGLCLDPPEFISWFFKYPARRMGRGRPMGYLSDVPPEHGMGILMILIYAAIDLCIIPDSKANAGGV